MTANLTPRIVSFGDSISYNEERVDTGIGFGGFSPFTVWTALEIDNTTLRDTLDGFEVFSRGTSATVDFEWYTSMGRGFTPTTSIHSKTGVGAYFRLDVGGGFPSDLSQHVLPSGGEILDVNNIYGDFSWVGTEIGTEASPFNILAEALAVVNAAGTVWMDSGSTSVTPTINQKVIFKTTGGTVTIGGP